MKITEKKLKKSVDRLCVFLAPHFKIDNPGKSVSQDGTEEMSVVTWDVENSGVRIAEIGVLYRNGPGEEVGGGSTIMRVDILNGNFGAGLNARLFLACENWLVSDLFERYGNEELLEEGKMLREEAEEQIDGVFKAMARADERAEKRRNN